MKSAEARNTAWYQAFSKYKGDILKRIECNFLAKVVKYDPKKHIADIQPLTNIADGTPSAQYLDVPVARTCYELDELLDHFKPDYQANDSNSKLSEHSSSNFIKHYPKKKAMRVGAVVVVAVLDRDSDNWDGTSATYTPASSRTHSANDSVITSVFR
ncbi:hypothetical protein [Lactobacillus acidophilus]|uniref:hypothetical protein n=1 Tax=Lactobacillus acidophilus TaxID=1579 RepID=UPI0021A4736C|nr:hypothetical protein [Lactobacillus acidophilus]